MAEINPFQDFPKFPELEKFFKGIGSLVKSVPEGFKQGIKAGSPSGFALPLELMEEDYRDKLSQELAREKAEQNLLDPDKLMSFDPLGGGDLDQRLRQIRDPKFREKEQELLQGTNRFPTLSESEKESSVQDLTEQVVSEELLEPRAKQRAEAFRKEEEGRLQGTPTTPENIDQINEDAFKSAMEDFMNKAGKGKATKGAGTGGGRSLEDYKKEFAKATGINIEGGPDKSNFLMALGLGLMQNRAGKGFDISKILTSVGEATEKAMPKLEEAQKQYAANKLAAGKYAIQAKAKDAATAAAAQKKLNETKGYFIVPTGGKAGLSAGEYLGNAENGRYMKLSNAQIAQLEANPNLIPKPLANCLSADTACVCLVKSVCDNKLAIFLNSASLLSPDDFNSCNLFNASFSEPANFGEAV